MQHPAFGALLQVQAFQSLWNSRLESNVSDTTRGFAQLAEAADPAFQIQGHFEMSQLPVALLLVLCRCAPRAISRG